MEKENSSERKLVLPQEIIEEILSRLPVKSLLKFRCVSKSWRSSIANKHFIKTHLLNSTKFSHPTLLLSMYQLCPFAAELKQCSRHSLFDEPIIDSFEFDDSINTHCWKFLTLVGCCNGLVCFLLYVKIFILWNPATRKCKKLPKMLDDPMIDIDFPRCGFGYDDSSDDYKVLGVVFKLSINEDEIRGLTLRRVYSLKTNSWKTMMDMDTDDFVGVSGVVEEAGKFACGNLHWNKTHRGLDSCIIRFDLKTEVYGEVEKPAHSKDSFCDNVGVLEGCLSFVRCNRNSELGVWVMKEYGVKESWVKLATVSSIRH